MAMIARKEVFNMKKDTRSQVFMFVQQINHLNISVKELIKKISHLDHLKKFAYIIHDKDKDSNGKYIKKHIHVAMIFDIRIRTYYLSRKLNQQIQYFEIMTKRGSSLENSINNCMAYLVHRTYQSRNKYQYPLTAVKANFNYLSLMEEISQKFNTSPKEILNKYSHNEITKINAIDELKKFSATTLNYYLPAISKIEKANQLSKIQKWQLNRKKTKKPINVIWIYGKAGVGKTRLAKHIAKKLSKNNKFDISGSSRDPFEGIGLNPSLIIDEIRPENIQFTDLLKITDNFNYDKRAPSRYNDKQLIADNIIITTPFSPINFYNQYKLNNSDSFQQLSRRLSLTIYMTDKKIIQQTIKIKDTNSLTEREKLNAIALTAQQSLVYYNTTTINNVYQYNQKITKLNLSDII